MKRSGNIIFQLIFLFIFFHPPIFGQSSDNNYIIQTELLIPVKDTDSISLLTDGQKMKLMQYFDGLGRLIQTNAYHQSPTRNDIIQHFEYDEAGRQKFSYLPFSYAFDGNYSSDAYDFTLDFYSASSWDPTVPHDIPYGETAFDDSPLNRVMKQGFPGESWQLDAHPQQFNYLTNAANDIPCFSIMQEPISILPRPATRHKVYMSPKPWMKTKIPPEPTRINRAGSLFRNPSCRAHRSEPVTFMIPLATWHWSSPRKEAS